MKNELTSLTLDDFRHRFANFHDAFIHEVQMERKAIVKDLNKWTSTYHYKIILNAQEWISHQSSPTNVVLEIEDVTKFILKKDESSSFSLIDRANIGFVEDQICLDFFESVSVASGNDFELNSGYKRKVLAVMGKRCYWSLVPYEQKVTHI